MSSVWRRNYAQVVEKLRGRLDTRHQQVVAGAGAGNVEQVPLGVVGVFEVGVVGDVFDPRLQGHDFVVTGGDDDGAVFESLGQVHRADGDRTGRSPSVVVELADLQP